MPFSKEAFEEVSKEAFEEVSKEAFEEAVQNAHIAMCEVELLACQQEVEFVARWAKEMDALSLEGVEMTVRVNPPEHCPVRADEASPSMGSENALAQAPSKLGSCFLVPQILD
jgi:aspartyl-tRNA(Asn)/glutamyl-tRNA(Gln) amidotransferase subunit C